MRIRSAGVSIVYSLWLRSRVIVGASVVGTFALGGVAAFSEPVPKALLGMVATMGFVIGLALLMGVVTYGGADLSTPESVYPKHVLVYPASTRVLVGAPMLFGTLIVAAFYLVAGAVALHTAGLKLPWAWPAGMMGAIVAWLQAASWSPYRVPFLRVGVILIVLVVLVPLGAAAQVSEVNSGVVLVASAILGGAAYPVALAGVRRARRGDGIGVWIPRSARPGAGAAAVKARPLASGAAAQFWFELRRNVWYPPAITALVEVVLFVPFVAGRRGPRSVFLSERLPTGAVPMGVFLAVPVFVLMVHAVAFGKFDMWRKQLEFPSFLTTRPVSTADIVAGKLRAAWAVTLLVWAVTLVVAMAFACVPKSYDSSHSWAYMIAGHASVRLGVGLVTGLLVLLIFTWSQIARSLWISMSGKNWLVHGLPSLAMAVTCGLAWVGYLIHKNPALQTQAISRAKELTVVVAWVKILAFAVVIVYLRRRGLIEAGAILRSCGWWLAACAAVCAGIFVAGPALRHSAVTVCAAVVLLVPLVRPAVAVLSLHYNRHR
jgi:hypothetical protein